MKTLKINQVIHLDPDDVEVLISEALKARGFTVEKVEFRVEDRWVGYGQQEEKITEFKGAKAILQETSEQP